MISAALDYHENGYCVLPVGKDKKPIIKWKHLQEKMPTRADIQRWWSKTPDANIGIVTGSISNICVVDVDSREGAEELKQLIPGVKPNVQTPNGGWHFYFAAHNGLGNATRFLDGVDFRGEGGYIVAPPSIGENGKSYKIVDDNDINRGLQLPKNIIQALANVSTYCNTHANFKVQHEGNTNATIATFEKGGRDEAIFHLANCLVKGGMADDNIRKYLRFFAEKCDPPFPPAEINIKIKSALDRENKRSKNLTSDLRAWIAQQSGNITATNAYHDVTIATLKEKAKVRAVLSRFVKEGVIEPVGKNAGVYRIIDQTAPDMDIFGDDEPLMEIKYPLGIHKFFETMDKNIVLFAADPDGGKTCMALNFVAMNMNRSMPIRFQTSEMSLRELKRRLKLMEPNIPYSHWKNVNFKERSSDWQDLIIPNGINVIDYIDMDEDFYLAGKHIRSVHEKLTTGMAFVCMQKKPGQNYAFGGVGTAKLPRLYVIFEKNPPEGNVAKIIKCKNRVPGTEDHNFRQCHFKIRNGSEISQSTSWVYPGKIV